VAYLPENLSSIMKKMSLYLLAYCLLLQIFTLSAQVTWQSPYRIDYFDQIDYSKNLVYTFNTSKDGKSFELNLYNLKGAHLNMIEVPKKNSLKIRSCAAVGTNTVFYFIDGNAGILLSVDKDGKEIASAEFEDKQSFSYDTYIQDCDGASFYLSRSIKGDKMGHTTEKFDLQCKVQWTYTLTPEKGKNQLMLANGGKNGVVLMSRYLKNAFAVEGPVSMIFLDAEGKVVSNTVMTLPVMFNPYMLKVLNDGSAFVVADYGKPASTIYPLIPLGTNYMKIKTDGSIVTNVFLENKILNDKFGLKKEDGTPLYTENPGVRIIDIIENGTEVKMVGESYLLRQYEITTPAGTTTMASTSINADLTLGDLYILTVGDLELEKAKSIWKPKKMYQMKGFFKGSIDYVYEEMMAIHAMTFQGFKGNDLIIRNFNHGFQYVNIIKDGESIDNAATRVYFGKAIGNSGSNMTYVPIESDNIGKAGQIYREGVMYTDQGILLYQYNNVTSNLQFSLIN
jgi:hypothetical protein